MTLAQHFRDGGLAMWLILVCLAAIWFVSHKKALYLFSAHQERGVFAATVTKLVEAGDWNRAIRLAGAAKTPLGRITRGGLLHAKDGVEAFERGMDEIALYELPALHRGIDYLALYANLAMLCGLFGTIVGLIKSFGSVGAESVDSSQKARILAEGISEAMNCTAFGLLTAVLALVAYAVLTSWAQQLEDDIHLTTAQISNAVRQRNRQQGP